MRLTPFQRRAIPGGILLLLVSGCASMRSGPFLGLKADDPPALSPYNRSLTQDGSQAGVPYQAARPADDAGTRLGNPEAIPESSGDRQVPETANDPPQTIRRRPELNELRVPVPGPSVPRAEPRAGDSTEFSASGLVLTVDQPENVLVSETATFEIVVRNPLPTPVENVVVECRFEDGLSFPGSAERGLRRQLGDLDGSEVRTIELALLAQQPGTHCVDFLLTATGQDSATERTCVTCVEPTVTLDLVGPESRTVGGRLEYVLSLVNVTGREVSGIVATITHDSALVPREASAGAVRSPGRLEWDLGLLRVEERVQIQVEFACPTATEQTCIAAEVTGRDMQPLRRERCVAVKPRETLDVAVADARDPLPVGETTTYLVTVTNGGLEPLGDVRLDVELIGGLEMIRAGSESVDVALTPASGSSETRITIPIAGPIAPDDARSVQIDVRAVRVGKGGVRVSATESAADLQATTSEWTVINPPLLDLPSFEEFVGGRVAP